MWMCKIVFPMDGIIEFSVYFHKYYTYYLILTGQVLTTSSGHFTAVSFIEVCVFPTVVATKCIWIYNEYFDV